MNGIWRRWTLLLAGFLALNAWSLPAQQPQGGAGGQGASDRIGPGRGERGQRPGDRGGQDRGEPRPAPPGAEDYGTVSYPIGLIQNTPQTFLGYTLFAPKHFLYTYLINNYGQVVHSWASHYEPGQSVYLLKNGHLLHCCFTKSKGFTRGGEGGRLEEYDWDGNLVWEFDYATDQYLMHHDVKVLPNGNILALAVEKKTLDDCLAAGFNPQMLRDEMLFPDYVVEVKPTRPKGGEAVWEWHVWDHLIQDNDKTKANYGDVAAHPELVDVDCANRAVPAFWNHMNSIAYNPKLDQITLSVRGCNEIWIIDHSTTPQESAGHAGGKGGKGGDLLYRWGNPAAYKRGTTADRKLFQQHDGDWIPAGYPGAGNLLIFNNGLDRGYSSIDEITPPVDENGHYILKEGAAYGPDKLAWTYQAKNPKDFYSAEISGAQRLPNGNTLICAGVWGQFFEVTPAGETVWQYTCPVAGTGPLKQGDKIPLDMRGHAMNAVFKTQRYAPDYPGLAGRDLAPKGVIEGTTPANVPENYSNIPGGRPGGGPDREKGGVR